MEQPPLAIMVRRPDGTVEAFDAAHLDRIDELCAEDGTLVWVSVTAPDEELLEGLAREFRMYRDLLATVLDARLTVASNSLNAIMKWLTAITVIVMLPTLIAGIYGMNFDVMPELTWMFGYPFALVLMLVAAAGALTWFRRNDWC